MNEFLDVIAPVWRPHPGQREFLLNPAKIKVLACGRRWGKTDACAVQVLSAIFEGRASRHFLVAPTQDQATILFDRVCELLTKSQEEIPGLFPEFKLKSTPYPKLRIGPHTVSARSGHQPRSLRGYEATHVIVDEAAYLPEQLMTEVLWPMLATNDGHFTLISTPRGLNAFWRFFRMGETGENGVWSRQASSSENPLIADSFLAVQRELISDRSFQTEYEAQFLEFSGAVFMMEVVEKCLDGERIEPRLPITIGIDWARFDDYSAIAVLSGPQQHAHLLEIRRLGRAPWRAQIAEVEALLQKYPGALLACDSTGMGQPMLEWIQHELPGVSMSGFRFDVKSKSDLIQTLVKAFESRSLRLPPDPQLIRELGNYESRQSDSGHVTTNAANGYHDDLVIALALAYFHAPRSLECPIRLGDRR